MIQDMKYTRYELEIRKYSSDVIIGVYKTINEHGKEIEKRDIVICPVLKKEDGDKYARFILDCLNAYKPKDY